MCQDQSAVIRRCAWFFISYFCFYSVCFCVSLFVCRRCTDFMFNIGGWNSNIDTYMWISQNGIFYFFNFFLFFSYTPFWFFNFFLYFKAATSQSFMKINTSNWSLGLVKCIMYNDIDFALFLCHPMTSEISKFNQCFTSNILSAY